MSEGKKITRRQLLTQLESFLRNYVRENPKGFLCSECGNYTGKSFTHDINYGFICRPCKEVLTTLKQLKISSLS